MNNKSIYKQPIALFFAGILGMATLGSWASVQAQIQKEPQQTTPPKFTKFRDAGNLKLLGDGKPFMPSNLTQTDKPYEGDRGIIGSDHRIPMTSRLYPWSSVGRIVGKKADKTLYTCTGTLIAENIVLTNAHYVIDPKTHQLSDKILFMPNVINGNVRDDNDIALGEQVVAGTDFTNDSLTNQVNDWAIIKINKPLGRKYGYLGWKSLPDSTLINKNREKLFFVGYSGDFPDPHKPGYQALSAGKGWTASFQGGCSIVEEKAQVLYHNCDTTGGSSGGPIIGLIGGQPYIVALNNAEITDPESHQGIVNLAVKIDFLDKLTGRK